MLTHISHHPLFAGMTQAEREQVLSCSASGIHRFSRGEVLLRGGQAVPKVGILLEGNVLMVRDDAFGNQSLLSRISFDDLFGLPLCFSMEDTQDVYLFAQTDCQALLLDAQILLQGCEHRCETHRQLLQNTLTILARKNIGLIRRQCHMARHSLRGKIASYLSDLSLQLNANELTVPFNRQGFADYLGVDRSALSAELSRMKRDGLLDYEKNRFTLYDPLFTQ